MNNALFMDEMIKLEEKYPMNCRETDNFLFNHCLTTFYDNQSEPEIHQSHSIHEIMSYLQENVDLCNTPLSEILAYIHSQPNFQGVDIDLIQSQIIKQKRILKRLRAKNRKYLPKSASISNTETVHDNEVQIEQKKKRNRISAQISRDKKKQKVKELEEFNQELQKKYQQAMLQNQLLKKEVEASKKQNFVGDFMKNKFTKLLILLGVVFLIGLLKDIFKVPSNNSIIKISEMEPESMVVKMKSYPEFYESEKKMLMEEVEEPLSELLESKTILQKVKQKISTKMGTFREEEIWFLPSRVQEGIKEMKQILYR